MMAQKGGACRVEGIQILILEEQNRLDEGDYADFAAAASESRQREGGRNTGGSPPPGGPSPCVSPIGGLCTCERHRGAVLSIGLEFGEMEAGFEQYEELDD
jgi:hypothetical protein